jgi:transaldolase
MKLFSDTAHLDELRKAAAWGIVGGITTNETMPFKVLDSLFHHPLTEKGLDQFQKDWNSAFKSGSG